MRGAEMRRHVIVGASAPIGVKGVELVRRLKLGNLVLTKIPLDFEEAMRVARHCKENGIHLLFSEWLFRGSHDLLMSERKRISRKEFFTKAQVEEICGAAGDCYLGRIVLGEVGGLLYWPREYIIGRASGNYVNLPAVDTVDKAKGGYVDFMKATLAYEREEFGGGPLWDVDSSMTFKYHGEAGFDGFIIESMPGDCNLLYSSIRGAAKACGKPWGAHIAMSCYGGSNVVDDVWLKRWQVSLYYSYVAGAGFIYPESGYFTHCGYAFDSDEMMMTRRVLREFNRFANIHLRPADGPQVKIAFAHGHLDGHPGLWNKYVWGQYGNGDKWLHGPPEFGWRFFDKAFRKEDWSNSAVHGAHDFSGHPAGGLCDVVPAEAPVSVLSQYQCLVFTAWNTMTAEVYENLKRYVREGGHLLMAVPHLNTETDCGKEFTLFNDGDVSELFGVKIIGKEQPAVNGVGIANEPTLPSYVFSKWACDPRFIGHFAPARVEVVNARVIAGVRNYHAVTDEELVRRPLLVEKSLGKGKAFLVTTWSWPGDTGMTEFFNDILRAVLAGENCEIRINGSDRIRHAIYGEGGRENRLPPEHRSRQRTHGQHCGVMVSWPHRWISPPPI